MNDDSKKITPWHGGARSEESGIDDPSHVPLVRTTSDTTYLVVGGARLRADEEMVSKYRASVNVVTDSEFDTLGLIPSDNVLLRESDSTAVWIMSSGARVLVPSVESLHALAGPNAQPHVVAAGSLNHIPAKILPTAVTTPPSMIFPPAKAKFWAPPIAKFWPRSEMPGTTLPNGARVVPIRGWMSHLVDWTESNISDPDVHTGIEPDPRWLDENGFDWVTAFTVGDILSSSSAVLATSTSYVGRGPSYKIELNGWLYWNQQDGNWPGAYQGPKPADWTTKLPLSDGTNNWDVADFPFDPTYATDPAGHVLQLNDYVEISGSLVTDTPHKTDMNYSQIFAWDRGYGNTDLEVAENSPGRHTEIHPPDSVEWLVVNSADRAEYVYGVVLVTPINALDPLSSSADLDVDLVPPGPRPSLHHRAKAVEYVGPESNLGTVAYGNANRTGAQVQETDTHVTISVGVSGGPFATPTGKFKAIYRVWWFDDPSSYRLQVSISPTPSKLRYHIPVTLTVNASDQVTGQPVAANILIAGVVVGEAGTPFVVTLDPETSRVWVPPVRRQPGGPVTPGYWEQVEEPVPVTVRTSASPLYSEVVSLLGSRVLIDDGGD